MLFNDYPFLLGFLPAAILLCRLADPHPQLRIWTLVLLSLAFYAFGNPPFIVLLVLSILINWFAALAYARTKMSLIITAAIVADLGVLAYFKYTNFLGYNLGLVLGRPMPVFDIALPLGISFFTFHHIMYLVDLRKGKAPVYPLGRYALYIAFFPQALAGPLARWSQVIDQFGRRIYAPGWQREFCLGISFIAMGLFEKIFLADRLGRIIDPIYAQALQGPVANGDAWLALSFNVQILFDFAGYSDIAIGLGLLFGVKLPFNFNAPFRSTSIQDFWQRWHITLMMFLRDYIFYPIANSPHPAPAISPAAVLLRHAADDGAMRPVARRQLELCAVGRAARFGARRLLVVAPSWSAIARIARLGADGDAGAADRNHFPRRHAGCRLAYLSGPCRSAQSRARLAPRAGFHRSAAGLPAAGEPGHHRAVDAPATPVARSPGRDRLAGAVDRTWRTQRQWIRLFLFLTGRPDGAAALRRVSARSG